METRYYGSTQSSLESRAHALIAGYIAHQMSVGRYQFMPDLLPVRHQDLELVKETARWLVDQEEALQRAGRPGLLRFPESISPAEEHMKRVLVGLRRHCVDDALYTSMDHRRYTIRTYLPDIEYKIRPILADPPFQPFAREDAIALALARWFKESFMTWVDPIKCPDCGGSTTSGGSVEPNAYERGGSAGRCELHVCDDPTCGGQRRFARYTSVERLLLTKEGRCGEWAQLFYVMLAATGVHARYVWCSEDHVWTEYWSPALDHWVHVDSCEAATNKSLLYARGWGKKQSFVLAAGPFGAEDVTRAYIDDWEECKIRRARMGWKERQLRKALNAQTITLRLGMNERQQQQVERMDRLHRAWMDDEGRRFAEAEAQELGGRVSGPEEWRSRRDELGSVRVIKPRYSVGEEMIGSDEHVQLLGDVKPQSEGLRLTSGPGQASAVFGRTPIGQEKSFRCLVTFRIIAPPGCGEADGMAVVFSPEAKIGLGGYGLGYSGLGGKGDFAVEIDTYRTQDFADDPPTPHISVHSPPDAHHRAAIATAGPDAIPWIMDGWTYTLELLYSGSSRTLRGFLSFESGKHVPQDGGNDAEGDVGEASRAREKEVALFETTVPKPDGLGKDWYVGITASTGGLWQVQDILEWSLNEIQELD